jgi:mono/diheme cytochrome c family protein
MTLTTRKRFARAAVTAAIVASIGNAAAQYQGWDIPLAGRAERSPLASSSDAASRGKTIFGAHCARCHGPEGKGNGPDSDHAADLTDELRDAINPDGVLFYKVWNGHAIQLRTQIDDMPAFRDKLSRDEVWAVVEYLKVLRMPRR